MSVQSTPGLEPKKNQCTKQSVPKGGSSSGSQAGLWPLFQHSHYSAHCAKDNLNRHLGQIHNWLTDSEFLVAQNVINFTFWHLCIGLGSILQKRGGQPRRPGQLAEPTTSTLLWPVCGLNWHSCTTGELGAEHRARFPAHGGEKRIQSCLWGTSRGE